MQLYPRDMLKILFRRRLKICFQEDTSDCGPACLDTIARFYGRKFPREFLRSICRMDRHGTSLATLARAAEQLGFRPLAVKVTFKDLVAKAPLPCIAFWPQGHFVVISGVRKRKVYVLDPAIGPTAYTRAEFEAFWLSDMNSRRGAVLLLDPVSAPSVAGARNEREGSLGLSHYLLLCIKRNAVSLSVGVLIALAIPAMLPFLSVALVDKGISNGSLSTVKVILIASAILTASRLIADIFQGLLLAYIGVHIDVTLIWRFLSKLCRLPLTFFEKRLLGDLLQKIEDQKAVQRFLIDGLGQGALALVSLVVYAGILGVFNPLLFAIFASGCVVYFGYSVIFVRRQRIINYRNFRLSSRKQSAVLDFLSGIEEIKLYAAQQQRLWSWQKAQQALGKLAVDSQFLLLLERNGSTAINEVINLLLTYVTAREVIAGRLSLGGMVAVAFLVGQLSLPLRQLAFLFSQSHQAALSYQRVNSIQRLEDEEAPHQLGVAPECQDIQFRNVSFRYGASGGGAVFEELDLRIPAGMITAVVGATGCGKTTLLRLLLKVHEATEGEILLGGVNLNCVSSASLRTRCGIVMQDGHIFSDSILNNIIMSDESVDLERLSYVLRVAQIRDFIESLPLGLETRIGQDGIGTSRGQAQRILIARALYRDPTYLLLDEATSALDAKTEEAVMRELYVAMRRKTAVIVAHRLSTVMHADQIVVLGAGKVMEQGDHDELLRRRGKYFELVKSQLARVGG